MYCKYCKENTHSIDLCVKIKCNFCGERGHPHWRCIKYKNKNKNKNDTNNDTNNDVSIDVTNNDVKSTIIKKKNPGKKMRVGYLSNKSWASMCDTDYESSEYESSEDISNCK